MDFGALPPEVNSGRMYVGPGPATLLAAAAAWESLAAELSTAGAGYESVISTLTSEWLGPASMAMAAAVAPFVTWLRVTAEQCEQAAIQAAAATGAYEAAFAMTVPPPLIAANRAQLMALIATNFMGQNTPAIMATEAQYGEMWAQDAAAMYTYAASSASASAFSAFTVPPQTANPGGVANQTGAVGHATATQVASHAQTTAGHVTSALQTLSTPGSSSSPALSQAAMGTGASLGSSGASAPLSALSGLTTTSKTATKGASTGVGATTGLASALGGASGAAQLTNALDLGSDFAGLGADSILGVEGAAGFPAPGGLGDVGGLAGLGPIGGLGEGASAGIGQASALGTLSVPPSWAETVSSVAPLPAFDAATPGGLGMAASSAPGAGVTKLPLGAMVGRESQGSVHRIGWRPSMIPHSPVAG